jgi:ubiquinone/menaquinone biosynthesis C-methylase UbiE
MYRPKAGMAVLDVGCGTGVHLDLYRRYGCDLFGIDTSASMLEVAKGRLGVDADLRLGDASLMPFDDDSFDLVISMLVLHEMDQITRDAVIEEMKRILRKDGCLLFIDFHPGPLQPFKGWLTKLVILLSEVAAGRRHFRNYRHFMGNKGLPTLIRRHSLQIEEQRIVAGGAMALYLLNQP